MTSNKSLKATVLSFSLLTVMAGAAVSPALGGISENFSDVSSLLIKMILTVPALFIIMTNLLFPKLTKNRTTKEVALTGLLLYIIGGCFAGLGNTIWTLLFFRAILGIGVGLLMPLSTGLISLYFEKNEQSKLLGYSAAMNNLGGIIAMSLSGYLVTLNWRYSFLVYLIALIAIVLVVIALPNTKMETTHSSFSSKELLDGIFYYITMFITMIIFYIFTTNFAIISISEGLIDSKLIGTIMSLQTLAAFIIGMRYSKIETLLGNSIKYFGGFALLVGFLLLATQSQMIVISIGLLLIGCGIGLLVPHLNTNLLSHSKTKNAPITMAYMSAFMYLGQFMSPLLTQVLGSLFDKAWIRFPYFFGIATSIILIILFAIKKTKK